MARITVEDCLTKIDNQYDLVLLAKERTTQLNSGSQMLVEEDNDKKTIISLREIGDGKILVEDLEKNAIKRLRKEPDEVEQLEETEEEENDEFENLYKGQISKSGVAVLPSKRVRRIPEVKNNKNAESNLAKEAISELKSEQPEIKEESLETKEEPLELNEEAPTTSEENLETNEENKEESN
jgi:DNA-directed RNA polymerase subunit omega